MGVRSVLVGAVFVLLAAPVARAQDDAGKVGLSMGLPAAQIGVIWHVDESVAIRPQISISRSSSGGDNLPDTSAWSNAYGVAGLFYFGRHDNLRPYFSPEYVYHRSTYSDDRPAASSHEIGGFVGAQYSLGDRFAVFGQAGIDYSHSKSKVTIIGPADVPVSNLERSLNAFGTRTTAGVILYF